MTKDEIILTTGNLVDKHVESAIQFRQSQADYKFRVIAELIGRKAADISIEYAISMLEELATTFDTEMLSRSRLITQVKIQELMALLK